MSGGLHEVAPVLIVGAGPTGMTAAMELAHHGIRSMVLDDGHELSGGSRAVAIHRTALLVWEKLACAGPMLDRGIAWETRRDFYKRDEIAVQHAPKPFAGALPSFLNLSQYETERCLLARLESTPHVELYWDHNVVGVSQDERGVSLQIEAPDGAVEVRGQYVIACDGGRSSIRKLLKLPFPGRTHDEQFLLADVRAELDWPREPRFFFDHPSHPDSTLLIHPQPDHVWRIDWQLGADADLTAERQPESLARRIKALLGEVAHEVMWTSGYRVQQRLLDVLDVGRVFFAGDAAHLMAPYGARGMNSSVHDVENLCWKLALVLQHRSPASLLASYQTERWPAQKHNQDVTRAAMKFIAPESRVERARRDAVLKISGVSDAMRERVNSGRMIDAFRYALSPLVLADDELDGPWEGAPELGARCPDAPYTGADGSPKMLRRVLGHGFVALVFSASLDRARELQSRLPKGMDVIPVSVCAVLRAPPDGVSTGSRVLIDADGSLAKAYGGEENALFIVRPDGHLAARRRRWTAPMCLNLIRRAAGG